MSEVWDVVAATLDEAGCDVVVGLPSDEPGLLDAAQRRSAPAAVAVRDQRAGACAAVGHAVVSGRPAVLALTSGPPFPNALTGLLEGASLCAPVVVVTTRVPASGLGRGGFQEVDQAALAHPIAKAHLLVDDPGRLIWALRRAVHLSVNGRQGVTVVEIADEVLRRPAPRHGPSGPVRRLRASPHAPDVERAAELMAGARRPLVLLGGGARAAGAGRAALTLAERWRAPVMTTAAGRGVIDEGHPLAVGLAGLYLTPPLHQATGEVDVLLAVGTRLEETARMGWPELDAVRLVHVDCDPEAFGVPLEPVQALLGDAALTLAALDERFATRADRNAGNRAKWLDHVARLRQAALDDHATPPPFEQSPVRATLGAVAEVFGDGAVLVQENGLNDLWSYHWPVLSVGARTSVVVPGEQTMMGFGVAAALGAAVAEPDRPTVVLCGDGAVTMSLPALATAAELRLGLVVVVFDNAGHGWPRWLRAQEGAPDELTRFNAVLPWDAITAGLGGTYAAPADDTGLRAALRDARQAAAGGRLAVVTVRPREDDVPVGVRRLFGSPS
ncbi:acetolactate synthase, large subunit, biosynthetic type [Actinomadura sp. NBRC 104412]|uniref:thiamine pyrophosphate-binding protein n=1 Tax=Actinomadura sp. NBRC 104412 TaxID=3032203 RepID=UPI00249FD1F6|nr:thiamine pyrophosphate-binding protein [Actinomadura sp. NBRC 104412]GLZ06505.1 acetolactate synthase, large subunit, biosynthetic type [Actinomadura sp. NBRC 104412]